MSDANNSVLKAGRVLESLFEDDFQGKTIREIYKSTGIDEQSVRRALISWKELGWVFEVGARRNKSTPWKVSRKLIEIAHAYQIHALREAQAIKQEYREITGEELKV